MTKGTNRIKKGTNRIKKGTNRIKKGTIRTTKGECYTNTIVSTPDGHNFFKFQFGTKNGNNGYLSNLSECPKLFKIFNSVEAAYQYYKLQYFTTCKDEEKRRQLLKLIADEKDGKKAKQLGSAKSYKDYGCTLDIDRWNENRINVMFKCLQERFYVDHRFRNILKLCKLNECTPLHTERCGKKSFWGGTLSEHDCKILGKNELGKLLMKLFNQFNIISQVKPIIISSSTTKSHTDKVAFQNDLTKSKSYNSKDFTKSKSYNSKDLTKLNECSTEMECSTINEGSTINEDISFDNLINDFDNDFDNLITENYYDNEINKCFYCKIEIDDTQQVCKDCRP
jgi:predicted NAD-dependent protein-ADP-ribosyltransferase YbiA (DUF1768 family)